MDKPEDFIPSKEGLYYQWLANLIAKTILRAQLFGWHVLLLAKPKYIVIPPGELTNVVIGRFPDDMSAQFDNTGTVDVTASMQPRPTTTTGTPVSLVAGTSTTSLISALGGGANHFMVLQNTSTTTEAKVTLYLPRFGWFVAACSRAMYFIDIANIQKQTAKEVNAEKDGVKKVENTFLRKEIKELKLNPAMTQAFMIDMEIDPQHASVPDESKPEPKVKHVPTGWEFTFNRKGAFAGVNIYRQRPGTDKILLKVLLESAYIDTEAMVNNTIYTFYFIDSKGKEVGVEGTYTVKV